MKVYTKTGDKGKTSLIGGTRVPKSSVKIEAYGTVDELNAHLGLVGDQLKSSAKRGFIRNIQNQLFTIGSLLALEPDMSFDHIPELDPEEIKKLELAMDEMDESLPEMKYFVLPGGHSAVSYCHIARTVCRRAERRVIDLADNEEVDSNIVIYLNRLSDYLFVLSRTIAHELGAEEIPWKPNN